MVKMVKIFVTRHYWNDADTRRKLVSRGLNRKLRKT